MSSPLAPGQLVAYRYRLQAPLGEGGMGTVWSAEHVATRQPVALKFPKRDASGTLDSGYKRRLLLEARSASMVKHPNVVTIHEVLELPDGSPTLVMDLLAGESLATRLERDGMLDLCAAATVLAAVASAVGAAHALGIVHRDLKPSNIFLVGGETTGESVRVLDFGVAKLVAVGECASPVTALTTTGTLLGTPAYMAPELLLGDSNVDHRVDVWALGLIAYHCLAGVLPTAGDHIGDVVKRVVASPIAPLSQVAPALPPAIAAIVTSMLSRAPAARPAVSTIHDLFESFGTRAHV